MDSEIMDSHWLTFVTWLSTFYKMLLVFQYSETLHFDILWSTLVWCCKSRDKFNSFKGTYFTVEHFCWNLFWRWLQKAQHSFSHFLYSLDFTCLVFVITTVYKIVQVLGGSPSLVVMGGDSSTEGRVFQ